MYIVVLFFIKDAAACNVSSCSSLLLQLNMYIVYG